MCEQPGRKAARMPSRLAMADVYDSSDCNLQNQRAQHVFFITVEEKSKSDWLKTRRHSSATVRHSRNLRGIFSAPRDFLRSFNCQSSSAHLPHCAPSTIQNV